MTSRQANTLSIQYVRRLLAGAARQGMSLPDLFSSCDLNPALLQDETSRLRGADLIRLMRAVMRQTEDEFIGLATDARSKPGTFSMMAHAVINCANLEQAIRRSAAFYELFETPIAIEFSHDAHEGRLSFKFGQQAPDEDVVQEVMVFVSLRFWSWLVGRRLQPLVIEFAGPAPAHAAEFQAFFKCPVVYDADCSQIRFPAAWLSLPLAQTPLSLSRFLRDSVALIIRGGAEPVSLADQVRTMLSKEQGQLFPELQVVAKRLSVSPQTLRRRLKEEHTSYQALKDEIREKAAKFYLAKPALSVDEIALMMGFSEASAFHRAFKKWTGMTPLACRRELLNMDTST